MKKMSVRGFCIIENVFGKIILYYEKCFWKEVFVL